uniref:polynucleotide adenylyltransferase n=1 Tax=Kryptolebias marmoratus TaxID=37003 RepID=A0A3Q3FJC4_KRYMA
MPFLNLQTTQAQTDKPKWFGLTGPISEDFPEEPDLVLTRKLTETLKAFNIYDTQLELQRREKALKRLESLYKEWLTEMCVRMNVPEIVTDNVGGKIFPLGSYHLGIHLKGSDIDVLCVGPGFLERTDFFTSFFEKLKAQEEVKDIRVVEAFVPVIKLTYDGIEVTDLKRSVPENINLLHDDVAKDMALSCVRSLDGYRAAEEILQHVPNTPTFRLTLGAIKLWAKQRNIYSSMLGFLGGISWAVLVARICQVYPNATTSTMVFKFFKVYSMKWPIPIRLRIDRCHLMPIITPVFPQQNTSVTVSASTFTILQQEIRRGHAISEEIQQKQANWSKLLEKPDFCDKYQYVLSFLKLCRHGETWPS